MDEELVVVIVTILYWTNLYTSLLFPLSQDLLQITNSSLCLASAILGIQSILSNVSIVSIVSILMPLLRVSVLRVSMLRVSIGFGGRVVMDMMVVGMGNPEYAV